MYRAPALLGDVNVWYVSCLTLAWTTERYCTACCRQLSGYFARFESRLTPANARQVQLLLRVVSALQRALGPTMQQQERDGERHAQAGGEQGRGKGGATSTTKQQQEQPGAGADGVGGGGCLAVVDFMVACHLDHINLFPLLRWVRESKLVMKVRQATILCNTSYKVVE